MAGNPTLPTENIDEVILRLLDLEPNEIDELDYETYKSYLKEILVEVTTTKRKIAGGEFNLLKNEFKKVRGKKGRFKIKKTKISADKIGLGGIRKQIKGTQKRLMLAPVGGVPKTQEKIETISQKTKESPLLKISETLDSILNTLIDIGKQDAKESEKRRRSEEEKKRTGRESSLESKTFEGIKKAISTITKPLQSIWDKIVNFITNIILGRIVLKLIDWIADPKNQGKIQSIIRFVKDWWPALLGSYILFGTKFGGLIRFIGGWAVKLAFQLGKVVIPKLLTLIAKNPIAALAVAGGIGAYAATQQNKERRDEAAKTDPSIVKPEETAKTGKGPGPIQLSEEQIGQQGLGLGFSGGGEVRWPGFSGGGFNFRGMMGGASMGAMFGPLGMLLGGALGSGKPQEMFSGLVSGPGGPKDDKVPAMLSDGEFVMSAGAVRKYGVDTLEGMNAAGGGTNKPKVVGGTTYAWGGGLISDEDLRRQAAAQSAPTGGTEGARVYKFDPNNPQHISQYDLLKKRAISKGLYQEPQQPRSSQRTTKVNRTPNQETYSNTRRSASSQKSPKSSWWDNWKSQRQATKTQSPPSSSPPPNTSSSSLMRKPTSALSTNVRNPGVKIPRGGSLSAIMMAIEMKQRKDEGQTNAQAGLGAGASALGGQLGWMGGAKAGALAGAAIGSIVPGLGTGVGAAVGAVAGGILGGYGGAMAGGKIADDFSGVNAKKERATRGVGGDVVGGYGLKGQSFKDAPKTSIITDDKGRPYVGHKALRNGKLTYVRSSAPGTGTTNPLEMLGRFINPGAYRDSDAKIGMKNQKIAMVNALESMQKQGMAPDAQARMMKQMGGNLKDTQNDLNYRKKMNISGSQTRKSSVKPLPRQTSRPQVAGGGMSGKRGSGANPSRQGTKPPSQSPTHRKGTMTSASAYGIMR